MEKEDLKNKCIELYLEGKTYTEIAKLTGWSRTFITNLIKNDEKIVEQKNKRIIKVYKRKNNNRMVIYIPTEFIENIGISKDITQSDYVDIFVDKKNKSITINKHRKK